MKEEQLFEIKQKFLQIIPHPKLIQKQIDRLKEFEQKEDEQGFIEIDLNASLASIFEQYISELLKLKLKIANSTGGTELYINLCNLKKAQNNLIKSLISYYPENCVVDDSSVKQSDPFDVYALLKELQEEKINENEIKDYLCKQFEADTVMLSELAKAVLRARKIGVG